MRMLRSKLLLSGAAFACAVPGLVRFPAGAAEFTFRLSNDVPIDHPMSGPALEACAKIRDQTGGRIEIQFFPNAVLGSSPQTLAQLRAGAIDFVQIGDNILASVVPIAGISGVAFAFGSYAEAWKANDGAVGALIRAGVENAGMFAFAKCWDNGYRQLTNSVRPIAAPADLKGLKLRVPEAPLEIGMFKALGGSPTPVSYAELYTALQTRLVDGSDLPMAAIKAAKIYEVQKYLSLTNHVWTGYRLIANAGSMQKLPKSLRDAVERNFEAAAVKERTAMEAAEKTLASTLAADGMTVNNVDVAPFRRALQQAGSYVQWRDGFGVKPWSELEKATGKLA